MPSATAPLTALAPSSRRGVALGGLVAGALLALSLPPWGWWPLAAAGFAVLTRTLRGLAWRRRVLLGVTLGVGCYVPGLWWMGEFNLIGAALVVVLETSFWAVALAACPPGRSRLLGVPAVLVLAEAARGAVPFGGLPMAGVALGQVGGPLAPVARTAGALGMVALAALAGTGLATVLSGRHASARRTARDASRLVGAMAVAAVVVVVAAAPLAPAGGGGPTRRVALVQGGGRRGLRALRTSARAVLDRHLAASDGIRPPVDLIVWPEDVIDVTVPIGQSDEAGEVGAVAARYGSPLVAGIVEDDGPDRFANASVVWDADGRIIDRYDKVHRVPFGEYVPGRSLIEKVVDLSVIPRDATPGHGAGTLRTSAGRLGIVISFEVYFANRARAAANAGGQLLLVPTNAASFKTSQVPTTEVAAARLRALETGRDVVQAAPTGYGAVIDDHGHVRARTVLGRAQVIERTVHLRSGRTTYVRTGDGPMLALAGVGLLLAWLVEARSRTAAVAATAAEAAPGTERRVPPSVREAD